MNGIAPTLYAISSITVLAGAAIAPAMGQISAYFPDVNPLFIKMIITLPSIMVIPCTMLSDRLCRRFGKKPVLIAGLILYAVGGCCGGLVNSIWLVLLLRAVLGIGMGTITPVCHSLPADFFQGERKLSVIGRMSAFVTIGAAACSIGAGWLAIISWRASFGIYAVSLFVLLMVVFFLPGTKPEPRLLKAEKPRELPLRVYLLGCTMCIYMAAFYAFPLGVAMHLENTGLGDSRTAGYLLALLSVIAFCIGLYFPQVMAKMGKHLLLVLLLAMGAGYIIVGFSQSGFSLLSGCVLVGIGLGGLTPLHFVEVNRAVAKEDTVRAMAVLIAGTFAGQFASPFLLLALENLPWLSRNLGIFGSIGMTMTILGLALVPLVLFSKQRNSSSSISGRR